MINKTMKKIGAGWLIFAAAALLPATAFAQATLYISPSSGSYKIGEIFSVLANINTGGGEINAASGQINFDNQKLEVAGMGFNRSIFNLWTEEPNYSNPAGTVRFAGGLASPGFSGISGAIVRITFKTKAAGKAAVSFSSGAVLANDGKGTNILGGMRGAEFNVLSVSADNQINSQNTAPSVAPASQPAGTQITAPMITDASKQLVEGDPLTVKGLAYPNGKILIFFQKGSADPDIEEDYAGADGRFSHTYGKTISAGFYRIWAKNITPEGIASDPSEVVSVEVVQPLFFRIGSAAFNYASIIVTLLALLVLAALMLFWIWWKVRRWQERQGAQIHETEKSVHESFEKLQRGLRRYVNYLTQAKSAESLRKRDSAMADDVEEELGNVEKDIEGEIEKIDLKKGKRGV